MLVLVLVLGVGSDLDRVLVGSGRSGVRSSGDVGELRSGRDEWVRSGGDFVWLGPSCRVGVQYDCGFIGLGWKVFDAC